MTSVMLRRMTMLVADIAEFSVIYAFIWFESITFRRRELTRNILKGVKKARKDNEKKFKHQLSNSSWLKLEMKTKMLKPFYLNQRQNIFKQNL